MESQTSPRGHASTLPLLDSVEATRRVVSPALESSRKSALGQFMTPASVARFMAGLFPAGAGTAHARLLDAGAGLGALSCAFIDRWQEGGFGFGRVSATAFEIDSTLRSHLQASLKARAAILGLDPTVWADDFILHSALAIAEGKAGRPYTHAILNPPYKKIANGSPHRRALSQVGIEAPNLYAGFVALAVEQLAPGGWLVAIVPRSFCNGTYFRPFREHLLARAALRRMHLFDSRSDAFSGDAVLQENVVIAIERDGAPGPVTVSTSTDDSFQDLQHTCFPLERVLLPGDSQRFIHVPTRPGLTALEQVAGVRCTLGGLGIRISTGPVVDFRLREHLLPLPVGDCAPLLYPAHFADGALTWPKADSKKPNAIAVNDTTRSWLLPMGCYCVVKRFSSKEERRRVVAHVLRPADFAPGTEFLAIENHLNVFNDQRRPLPEALTHGLAAYLNTTAFDEAFRRFSGHTQVNAGDLRALPYPSRNQLDALGRWYRGSPDASQEALDRWFVELAT